MLWQRDETSARVRSRVGSMERALERPATDDVRDVWMYPCRVASSNSGWNSAAGIGSFEVGESRYSVVMADDIRDLASSICANVDDDPELCG